ncbi:MAG: 3-hydroxyacyl-CoA dehydrogenase NAD-binding domain-containing protein, partial [Bacillota bacterium]|nr:3-hydroxyacyl-CoA dehydrogenase NAD-binding domain-containing protein [Bacillota bacterium]
MEVRRVFVAGAGQMGSGIAQVAAQAGLQVTMQDIASEFLDRGMATIRRNLARSVEKGRITAEEEQAILERLQTTLNLEAAAEADVVVEAIVENLQAKKDLFSELDRICPAATILASNTSSLPITELAASTKRPDRFIGMHFMNPVPVMQLVEVVRGHLTSDETHAAILDLAVRMGKTPVTVQDYPGFVANRVLFPMINEA